MTIPFYCNAIQGRLDADHLDLGNGSFTQPCMVGQVCGRARAPELYCCYPDAAIGTPECFHP